jgi:hypothetical protein
MCYPEQVKLRMTMSKLPAALAVLGLLLAPVARPAVAATMQAVADHSAMEMAADMPCCPEQGPAKDCVKDCPLMAICMASSVPPLPAVAAPFLPPKAAELLLSGNDADPAGLGTGPPQRPPKT